MNLVWVKAGCASCCILFSVFGIIFLVGLGLGYSQGSPELVGGPIGVVPEDPGAVGTACFIAAGIYVGCLIFCGCQLWMRKRQERLDGFRAID